MAKRRTAPPKTELAPRHGWKADETVVTLERITLLSHGPATTLQDALLLGLLVEADKPVDGVRAGLLEYGPQELNGAALLHFLTGLSIADLFASLGRLQAAGLIGLEWKEDNEPIFVLRYDTMLHRSAADLVVDAADAERMPPSVFGIDIAAMRAKLSGLPEQGVSA